MTFVSITRLRVRSLRFMPAFAVHALKTSSQVRGAEGFVTGSLLPDRSFTFWTMTLWHEQADMRRYMTNGAHLKAMPRLLHWCDEASIVHWNQDGADLPRWDEADRRMRAEGRPSKLLHPSASHGDLSYRPPRTSRAAPRRFTLDSGLGCLEWTNVVESGPKAKRYTPRLPHVVRTARTTTSPLFIDRSGLPFS